MQPPTIRTPRARFALFCAVLLSSALLSGVASAAPPTTRGADLTTKTAPKPRLALTTKTSQRWSARHTARQRRAAQAKAAGPAERLTSARLSAAPAAQLLRVRVVDHYGTTQREFMLEILVSQAGSASLETEIGDQRYELSVSPDQRGERIAVGARDQRHYHISLRRRGDDSFSISTRVDPRRPGLVARSRSDTSRTEIYIER